MNQLFDELTAKSLLILLILILTPSLVNAQIIRPASKSDKASSQLIYYFNMSSDPDIQVTNTNPASEVSIHVQIFRNFDTDGPGSTPPVICEERNFTDLLTPNDTHVYDLDRPNFPKNNGETSSTAGQATSIDLSSPPNSLGFVVITPIVSSSNFTAISFHHLIGGTKDMGTGFRLNAVGRDAVDFLTGQLLPDGITLDGVLNGFVVLQPGELLFEYEAATGMAAADIIGIVFIDDYGPPGLLGYRSTPGTSNWSPFIFDFKEGVTSCGNTDLTCFFASGLNSSLPPFDTGSFIGGSTLCGGGSSQEQPGGLGAITGWTRIFVSGLGDFENQLGLILNGSPSIDAFWMKARP